MGCRDFEQAKAAGARNPCESLRCPIWAAGDLLPLTHGALDSYLQLQGGALGREQYRMTVRRVTEQQLAWVLEVWGELAALDAERAEASALDAQRRATLPN